MPGALDPKYISATQFPKVFAWVDRFSNALKQAGKNAPKAVTLPGGQMPEVIGASKFYDAVGDVDANDPTGLKAGDEVTTWPTDTGSQYRDTGKLLTLTANEIVIAKQTKVGGHEIHVHMPRWGFRIAKTNAGNTKL
jgi:hypothetical protein